MVRNAKQSTAGTRQQTHTTTATNAGHENSNRQTQPRIILTHYGITPDEEVNNSKSRSSNSENSAHPRNLTLDPDAKKAASP